MGGIGELEIKVSFVMCTSWSVRRICLTATDLFHSVLKLRGQMWNWRNVCFHCSVRISGVKRESTSCLTFRYALALEIKQTSQALQFEWLDYTLRLPPQIKKFEKHGLACFILGKAADILLSSSTVGGFFFLQMYYVKEVALITHMC